MTTASSASSARLLRGRAGRRGRTRGTRRRASWPQPALGVRSAPRGRRRREQRPPRRSRRTRSSIAAPSTPHSSRRISPAMAYAALDYYAHRRALHPRGADGARHRARARRRRASCRRSASTGRPAPSRTSSSPVFGEMGLLGPLADRLRLRRDRARRAYGLICQELERGDSGFARSLGAGLARDVPDLGVRLRGAEAALAARDGGGPRDRLLRPDRAGLRLEPERHADHRDARRAAATC